MSKEIKETLKKAAEAYYNGTPIMSDKDYDALYDQLEQYEKETGDITPDSPTQNVGAPENNRLKKTRHEHPALSLDKTKDIPAFIAKMTAAEQAGRKSGTRGSGLVIMPKEDGSTVIATYKNGHLELLESRGDGISGCDITHNAGLLRGLPSAIDYDGKLIVRGEAVMSYKEFNRINEQTPVENQFANPRNLATATINMLDANDAGDRQLDFLAFDLVYAETIPETPEKYPYPFGPAAPGSFLDSMTERLLWMQELGFQVVPFENFSAAFLKAKISKWTEDAEKSEFPLDGLVVAIDHRKYALSQPSTGHNPHYSVGYALKWKDETAETILRDIEWSLGKTGALTPVAIFDPVELEGTTVMRASVHNAGYVMQLDLKPGDRITVFKANKIIPQIAENLDATAKWNPGDDRSNTILHHLQRTNVPEVCPCCGSKLFRGFVCDENGNHSDTFIVECENKNCSMQKLRVFEHFADRECMNISGLSTATLSVLINNGWVKEFADLYYLNDTVNRDCIEKLQQTEGFGEKSVQNLLNSIEESRNTDFVSFVHALSIPNVGKGQAKLLKNWLIENFRKTYTIDHLTAYGPVKDSLFTALCTLVSEHFDFTVIEGIGDVISSSLTNYLQEQLNKTPEESELIHLLDEINFKDEWEEEKKANSNISGKTFVVTGKVVYFANRDALHADIESRGGKTSGSVTKNTDYLINNDKTSTSGKNKKAAEIGIPVISEEEYLKLVGNTIVSNPTAKAGGLQKP